MQKTDKKKYFRIIDANFNRAKEGLRVCEDVCRFFLDDTQATRQCKSFRHKLTNIITALPLRKVIDSRNIEEDVGKVSTSIEFSRKKTTDIFYANSQRVKESIRVLEEVSKLFHRKLAQDLKSLRYKFYAFEKKIIAKL